MLKSTISCLVALRRHVGLDQSRVGLTRHLEREGLLGGYDVGISRKAFRLDMDCLVEACSPHGIGVS